MTWRSPVTKPRTTFKHTTLLRQRVIVAAKRFLSISTLERPQRDRISFLRPTNRTRRRTTTLSRSSRLPFKRGCFVVDSIDSWTDYRNVKTSEPVLARGPGNHPRLLMLPTLTGSRGTLAAD